MIPRLPVAVERDYARLLRRRLRAIHEVTAEMVLDVTRRRTDASGDEEVDAVLRAVGQVVVLGMAPPEMAEFARRGVAYTEGQVRRMLRGMPTIPLDALDGLPDAVAAWSEYNAALIKTIEAEYLSQVAEQVRESLSAGEPTRGLSRRLAERHGVSRARAALIARDQIASLNAWATEAKYRSAGVQRYRWSTSGDERVRSTHRALDGRVFGWDDPPPVGHPGEDIQCRCVAIPVVEDPGQDAQEARVRRETGRLQASWVLREQSKIEARRQLKLVEWRALVVDLGLDPMEVDADRGWRSRSLRTPTVKPDPQRAEVRRLVSASMPR